MGFWDFLKKLKTSSENKSEIEFPRESQEAKIKIAEIEAFAAQKKKEAEDESEKLLTTIRTRLSQTIGELENERKDIEVVDLGKHKVELKIKHIVKQNLDNYVDYLGRLIISLKEIDKLDLDRLVPRINFLFYDFEKKSVITFQKATFLIGKELEAVRLTNKSFFNDLRAILDSNKELADKAKTVHALNEKVKKLIEQDRIIAETKKRINDTDKSINLQEIEISEKEEEIERIEKTDEHKRRTEIEGYVKSLKEDLSKHISTLNGLIDFKALAKVIHTNKKKMDILNEYKSNFEKAFVGENGEKIDLLIKKESMAFEKHEPGKSETPFFEQFLMNENEDKLISMLKESQMLNESIINQIQKILSTKRSLDYRKSELNKTGKDEIKEIELEIAKERNGVANWEKENEAEKKKLVKFEITRKEILDSIKAELLKMKVEIED